MHIDGFCSVNVEMQASKVTRSLAHLQDAEAISIEHNDQLNLASHLAFGRQMAELT